MVLSLKYNENKNFSLIFQQTIKPDQFHESWPVLTENLLPVIKEIKMSSLLKSFQGILAIVYSIKLGVVHTVDLLVPSFLLCWLIIFSSFLCTSVFPLYLSTRFPVSVL